MIAAREKGAASEGLAYFARLSSKEARARRVASNKGGGGSRGGDGDDDNGGGDHEDEEGDDPMVHAEPEVGQTMGGGTRMKTASALANRKARKLEALRGPLVAG